MCRQVVKLFLESLAGENILKCGAISRAEKRHFFSGNQISTDTCLINISGKILQNGGLNSVFVCFKHDYNIGVHSNKNFLFLKKKEIYLLFVFSIMLGFLCINAR